MDDIVIGSTQQQFIHVNCSNILNNFKFDSNNILPKLWLILTLIQVVHLHWWALQLQLFYSIHSFYSQIIPTFDVDAVAWNSKGYDCANERRPLDTLAPFTSRSLTRLDHWRGFEEIRFAYLIFSASIKSPMFRKFIYIYTIYVWMNRSLIQRLDFKH